MYIIPDWTGQSRRQEVTLRVKISRERGITYFARRFVSEKDNLEIYHTRILDLTKRLQPGFSRRRNFKRNITLFYIFDSQFVI